MKRTKKETRENYLAMMTDMWKRQTAFHLGDMINKYKVSANIGSALVKRGFIKRTFLYGYYKWVIEQPTPLNVTDFMSMMNIKKNNSNKPAPEVVEVSNAVGAAYPKECKSDLFRSITEAGSILEREQEALNILADIMRDNQHITYTLKRIEREVKETETNLLK